MTLAPDSPRLLAAAKTRAKVARIAQGMFSEHGYEFVTVREIAKAARCSTGVIFNNWPEGKDQLFAEVMGRRPVREAQGAAALAAVRAMQGREA